MSDPRSADSGGIDREADCGSPPGIPRWVKVVGIVVIVAALVVAAFLLVGGEHGPARHASTGGTGGTAPAAASNSG